MKYYAPGMSIAGRYEVTGRPLMGGMGVVYLCWDHLEDRPVALKTFQPKYLPNPAARDRFLREGTLWMELGRHPHVVRCYDVEYLRGGQEIYLVLELVAKEQEREDASLRSWLVPGVPLQAETALLFTLQIVRAMKHAAGRIPKFVHRDLKPENVLVGADLLSGADVNHIRVTDFGLASVLRGAGQHFSESETGSQLSVSSNSEKLGFRDLLGRTQLTRGVVGTPLYMAPEQWAGEKVTIATDVYALGLILYEMVVGQRALPTGTLETLEQSHRSGKLRPVPAGVSTEVAGLIRRCLKVEPTARYATWESVEAVLEETYSMMTRGKVVPPLVTGNALDRAERIAIGWAQGSLGMSYQDIGKENVAIAFFERMHQVGVSEAEPALRGAGLSNLGVSYRRLGDIQQAIHLFEQAVVHARESGDKLHEGRRASNVANAYEDLGDYKEAINWSLQALTISREIGDREGEGNILGNLGIIYDNLGEMRQAIPYYKQALTIRREVGDRRGEGNDLGNLGVAHYLLGDIRQAIYYFERALIIRREIVDRRGEGNDLGNLGTAYRDLGDDTRALRYYEQALAIKREIGNLKGMAETSAGVAEMYARKGKTDQAIRFAQQAADLFVRIGDHAGGHRVQQWLTDLQRSSRL